MKLTESTFAQKLSKEYSADGYVIHEPEIIMFLEAIMEGTSDFLRMVKSRKKTTVVFRDLKNNFIIAAVLEYTVNGEDGEAQDNFNYYWTFDEEDIAGEDVVTYDNTSEQILGVLANRCAAKGWDVVPTALAFVEAKLLTRLADFIDSLATENEEVIVEHDGYFSSTVVVENGLIEKNFIPDGPIKVLIKDDASTEAAFSATDADVSTSQTASAVLPEAGYSSL